MLADGHLDGIAIGVDSSRALALHASHWRTISSILAACSNVQNHEFRHPNTLYRVVCVVMTISMVVFTGMSWNVPQSKRLYHVLTTFIVTFAALSYFAMATGHGIGYHHTTEEQHHKHVPSTQHDIYRQVYWARYVDWTVTTPLLLLDLALLAGLPGANILIAIVADIIMVLTGLFASFGSEQTAQKWGWYTIACIAYLVVIWQLVYHGRNFAAAKGGKLAQFFAAIGGFTLVIWTVYPM
jgi:bacteriorhodopsin